MGYKLLGIVVWRALKWTLRRRYGAAMVPKPVLAGGVLLVIAGVLLGARQRAGDE